MGNVKSVLDVDDEIDIVTQLNKFLEHEGYQVFTALDGETGLSMYIENSPPVAIIDYKITGMDGIQLLRAIKVIKEHAFYFLQKTANLEDVLEKVDDVFHTLENKKKQNRVTGNLLLTRNLDRSIPITEITVTIELDEIISPVIAAELESNFAKGELSENIIISLENVQSLNNIGLNTLIRMNERSMQTGHKLAFGNLHTGVIKYLQMLGYAENFSIVRSSLHTENTFIKK